MVTYDALFLFSDKYHERSKYSKNDKDSAYSKSDSQNDHSDAHKRNEKPAKCWLFPQTRLRIISKDYKKGKYYNKKVRHLACFKANSTENKFITIL